MVREIKAKAVLRLDGQGLSGRAMARSLGIARGRASPGRPAPRRRPASAGMMSPTGRTTGCTRSCSRAGASVRACTSGPIGPGRTGSWRVWA